MRGRTCRGCRGSESHHWHYTTHTAPVEREGAEEPDSGVVGVQHWVLVEAWPGPAPGLRRWMGIGLWGGPY